MTVLTGSDVPVRNTNDWSPQPPEQPLAVVRPAGTDDVSAALRICHEAGLAVVPQGGLTGLCGGSRPIADAIALSLERMVGIEEIDADAGTITVLAGTPLAVVQRAADDAGFFFPLDLGARGSCAIGGNLSTNAGGNRVIRYGMAREMTLGLEVVLPDGTVVTSLNKMLKNNAGYDLKHLFIGSEGTLGVITRAVLRMHPKPACTMVAMCALKDYAGVLALLAAARRDLGPLLSAFEVMWPDYWDVATQQVSGVRNPFEGDATTHGAYVLIEALGTDPAIDVPRFGTWLETQLELGHVPNAVVAQSMSDAAALWGVRDACSEFIQAIGPHLPFDVGLPTADMDDYARRCRDDLAARIPGARSMYYGHIGDGNLHLIAWLPGAAEPPKQAIEEVVYGLVREFHGSVSAEHGIGTLKKPWLGHARTPEEIALMRTLKKALDPKGILNPGKVV
ncbi:FAD-binding oxidoreductase [Polaromonas jejuensis]|uniref:FAD-binding oxidoreductase n=1 Tax=Polaromonas jejuensis TaxID=457502 RepID=A0ABW0QBN9_9BURK